MNALKNLLDINTEFTKKSRKPKAYNKVKNNIPLIPETNFMMDYLFLPQTKEKFKYLLTVVDLATDEFDIEPMKDKKPISIVEAVEEMKKRKYIHLEKNKGQSVRTDSGTEFKGEFDKWLYNHSILHRVGYPNRHIQQANIERLNGILGSLINGFMNSMEAKSHKVFKEWLSVIPTIREKLNEVRKKEVPKTITDYQYPPFDPTELIKGSKDKYKFIEAKYKVGDLVYVSLQRPENALGEKQSGNFREGDYRWSNEPREITKVFYYSGKPYYRYRVNTYKGVSFQEDELRLAKGKDEELYEVKQILDKKTIKKEVHYLIWWYGEKKKEATWEPRSNLMKSVPDLIKAYDNKK